MEAESPTTIFIYSSANGWSEEIGRGGSKVGMFRSLYKARNNKNQFFNKIKSRGHLAVRKKNKIFWQAVIKIIEFYKNGIHQL